VTSAAQTPGTGAQHAGLHRIAGREPVRAVRPAGSRAAGADQTAVASEATAVTRMRARGQDHSPAGPASNPAMRSWPLPILALSAAVALWSGWVGIGQLTGFGQIHLCRDLGLPAPEHRRHCPGRRRGLRRLR